MDFEDYIMTPAIIFLKRLTLLAIITFSIVLAIRFIYQPILGERFIDPDVLAFPFFIVGFASAVILALSVATRWVLSFLPTSSEHQKIPVNQKWIWILLVGIFLINSWSVIRSFASYLGSLKPSPIDLQTIQRPTVLPTKTISPPTLTPTPFPLPMDLGEEGTMSLKQYVNAQYGYRVKYPSYLTPNVIDDDLTLSFMSFDGPTENDEGSFSIIVNDTTLEKQVELEKWKASHVIMESVKEKRIVKDGYSGVRLDFVPRPDVGDPRSIVVLHNEKYSYSISAETTHIDEILRMFTLFPYPYFGDTQRTTDINMLQTALELYRADRERYPNTLQDLVPSYLVTLPLDPATQFQYVYQPFPTKLDYSLSAQLDDGTTLTREAPK